MAVKYLLLWLAGLGNPFQPHHAKMPTWVVPLL